MASHFLTRTHRTRENTLSAFNYVDSSADYSCIHSLPERQLQQQITGKQTKPNAHKHHFARNHESLRVKHEKPVQRKGQQKPIQYRNMTPALAADLTTRRWSVMQLISYPLP